MTTLLTSATADSILVRRLRGEVGQLLHELVEGLRCFILRGLGVLDLLAELLGTRQQLSLFVALRLGDQLSKVFLLTSYGLEGRDCRPSSKLRGQEFVDDIGRLATAALSGSYGVWVVSQNSGVDHASSLSGTLGRLSPTCRCRAVSTLALATAIVVGADRFVTGNRRDYTSAITEIPISFPS